MPASRSSFTMTRRLQLISLLLLLAMTAVASSQTDSPPSDTAVAEAQKGTQADAQADTLADARASWLISELAAAVDLVALVQVEQTQYKYRRGFPISGYADLRILIPYKMGVRTGYVRVRESGLRDNACYFPQTFLGDEGARFLVFMAAIEDNSADLKEFVGHPVGCKLAVLVTDEHDYALRYPLDGMVKLTDEQKQWVQQYQFSDPAAFAGEPELTPGRKQQLAEQVSGIVDARGVKYTLGIHSNHFIDLIGRENLRRATLGGKY